MDLRDQLKNLFPDHEEQDFEMPEEQFKQKEPLVCKFEKKGRNGKPVTIVEGWEGSEEDLKKISKKIKMERSSFKEITVIKLWTSLKKWGIKRKELADSF
jgi:translation initiation factor 1 (eIF-1/SUI1)